LQTIEQIAQAHNVTGGKSDRASLE
jgi:hypothetical protein